MITGKKIKDDNFSMRVSENFYLKLNKLKKKFGIKTYTKLIEFLINEKFKEL